MQYITHFSPFKLRSYSPTRPMMISLLNQSHSTRHIATIYDKHPIIQLPNTNNKVSSSPPHVKYNTKWNDNEHSLILHKSENIYKLLNDITIDDLSKFNYNPESLKRIFINFIILPQLPKLQKEPTQEQFENHLRNLTRFKYINHTPHISKCFRSIIYSNDELLIPSITTSKPRIIPINEIDPYTQECFTTYLDFFSQKPDQSALIRTIDQMQIRSIPIPAIAYNLIARNYLSKTSMVLERLTIWEQLLQDMKSKGIQSDLGTWYTTLSIIPTNVPLKTDLKSKLKSNGWNSLSHYHDIELSDIIQKSNSNDLKNGDTLSKVLTYFTNIDSNEIDINCINSIIFTYLKTDLKNGGGFQKAWEFMETINNNHHQKKNLKPRYSTLTIFVKHGKVENNLLKMLKTSINMWMRFGLINQHSCRIIIHHLLNIPNHKLKDQNWYPLIIQFILRFHLKNSLEKFRRIDLILRKIEYKLRVNFPNFKIDINGNGNENDEFDEFLMNQLYFGDDLKLLNDIEDNDNDKLWNDYKVQKSIRLNKPNK
ncbi:hypothetical protein CANARDRAFT_192166 [[Candida] arabinofermentans NRRL YB-2248]|uniref:Uncharacterized protein n=1 Tax=[Candida] arabinofermentans NRRL YB-2248 TaxID=983967 RepID=A0A1E4SU59_9ASCO|nr:hypothetical protein CANARDRAFT_192166 [[Candida] arabinofermentans NRRL YB-2248]